MKTIKSSYLDISLAIVLVVIFFQFINIRFIHYKANNETNKQIYSVETFRTGKNGWGYNILCGEKIMIKQDIIPAVESSIPFQCEEDAKRTACLVIDKLNHKRLPTVTKGELDSLHVIVFNKMVSE